MNILSRVGELAGRLGDRREVVEPRATMPVPQQTSDWVDFLGERSASGVWISPTDALAISTVQACVALIARTLASVPLVLYRKTDAGGRAEATDHPLYAILHDLANPYQTAFDVRLTMFANTLLYGNAYAEIEWGPDGYPVALWPLPPERVTLYVTTDRQLIYQVTGDVFGVDSRVRWLPAYRVHHLRDLTISGLLGMSRLRSAGAISLAMATEEFGTQFFSHGAHPSIVLSHPGKLQPEAVRNLRKSFESQWSGPANAHRVAVVGDGVKPEAMRITANESQFLETRAFQVAEICRLFNVSPGLVGAAETQTYASAEQDMLRLRELTLGPLAEGHEKAILRDLLVGDERRTLFAKYKMSKLQATDLKTRFDTYALAKQNRILTSNEVRLAEDYNPIPGGDVLDETPNLAPKIGASGTPAKEDGADANDQRGGGAREAAPEEAQPLVGAWLAETERRFRARVANDVRQDGAKTLRKGGKTALDGWIAEMRKKWMAAGLSDMRPLMDVTLVMQPIGRVQQWIETELALRCAELEGSDDGR